MGRNNYNRDKRRIEEGKKKKKEEKRLKKLQRQNAPPDGTPAPVEGTAEGLTHTDNANPGTPE